MSPATSTARRPACSTQRAVSRASSCQAKALLAAEIVKALDAQGLSTRQAEARTGVGHAEFSRIRNVRLDRFTLDRLLTILEKLGQRVELSLTVTPRQGAPGAAGMLP